MTLRIGDRIPFRPDEDLIFGGIKEVKRPFGAACRAIKIQDLRKYDFRQAFVSRSILADAFTAVALKAGGHASDEWKRYLNMTPDQLRNLFVPLKGQTAHQGSVDIFRYRRLHPMSQRTGLDTHALSRDPRVIRRYEADPLVRDKITISFFTQVHAAGEAIIGRASELTIPTLVMHGSADRITSPAGAEDFVATSSGKAALKIWKGFFHEIHNEPEWMDVAAFVVAWIENADKPQAKS